MENERKFSRLIDEGTEAEHPKKEVRKKHLINRLNYINFQDDTIFINFKHVKYDRIISLKITPLPCLGDELECAWAETDKLHEQLAFYKFKNILVPCNQKILLIKPDEVSINEKGVSFILPETCYEIDSRKLRRHSCKRIKAQLIQNSALFYGDLIDFSTTSFRVEVTALPPQTFQWIDSESTVNLIFSNEHEMLYSGEFKIIKQTFGQKKREYVIEPLGHQIRRFKPKEFRSTRQELVPSPNIIFRHPFTKKNNNLKVFDLSGSGFSVEEDKYNAVLFPGLIIPELEINFANSFNIKCKAQVVYKKIVGEEENGGWTKCGLALLDMDIEDHGRLSELLHQAKNRNSYISNIVDMDDLWSFFFESGFIYPKKYVFFQENKDKIKETYKKLYTQNQQIARHFIYQDKGRILSHLSMVRFYENAWMIQHHAANRSASIKAGITVLDQIGRFINDSHRLYTIKMNFVFCYFRPENKFPNRVFGEVARNITDSKCCSLDMFAYFHYKKIIDSELHLPEPWRLIKTEPEDLADLESFYDHESGGLMLDALDIKSGLDGCDDLSKEYQRLGFKRERHLFSLKKDGILKAVVMVNISDIGLNLADLTNCIKVIV
ncbi:MAG: PilZ domain-containing protein, partial [Deltaproteobacteria bacterium]|nr:PilZ domain-containing protein [Deltaproteobacteria bacterium]